jgi:hypothetical protein
MNQSNMVLDYDHACCKERYLGQDTMFSITLFSTLIFLLSILPISVY